MVAFGLYKVTCNLTQKFFHLDLRDDRINQGLEGNVDMTLRYDGSTQCFYYNSLNPNDSTITNYLMIN